MKIKGVQLTEVKSLQAAKNQAAFCLIQIESRKRRKEKIMETRNSIAQKIERLTKQLKDIDQTLADLDVGSSEWFNNYQQLMTDHQLVEADILKLQSDLIQRKINRLEEVQGLKSDPKNDTYTPEG